MPLGAPGRRGDNRSLRRRGTAYIHRCRLPELFLRRVESRRDKVVTIPKGPVDEPPVFGNDGLLYIVSLVINATRIVNLADGKITDDSDPFDVADATRREARPMRKTSMSFVTALGLSARNLMTKKGRTAMTAFAGSIGIIGIAAILALSNGVNGYIKKVEEDTLSGYPLTISKQDYDLSSMMGGQGPRMTRAAPCRSSSMGSSCPLLSSLPRKSKVT